MSERRALCSIFNTISRSAVSSTIGMTIPQYFGNAITNNTAIRRSVWGLGNIHVHDPSHKGYLLAICKKKCTFSSRKSSLWRSSHHVSNYHN